MAPEPEPPARCAPSHILPPNHPPARLHPPQYLHGLQRVYGTACTRAAMELPQCDVRENCRLSTDSYKDYCTACTQPADCDYYGLQVRAWCVVDWW